MKQKTATICFLKVWTKSVRQGEEKQREDQYDHRDDHVQVPQGVLVLAREGVGGAPPSLDDHDDGREEKEDTCDQCGKVEGLLGRFLVPVLLVQKEGSKVGHDSLGVKEGLGQEIYNEK